MTGGAMAPGRRSFTRRVFGPESAVWRLDVVMLVAVLALVVIGSLLVWSSTRTWAPGSTGLLWKHLLNQVIGLALCGAVAMTDYRAVRAYAPMVFLVSLIGLGLVLSPLGATINGSHSWILLGGGFAVQPSEFAKVGLVLVTAMLLAQPAEGTDRPRGLDVLLALVAAGITLVLVMLQPDLGTALVLAAVTAAALIIAGVRKRLIVLLTLVGAAGIFCVFFFEMLEPYQVARFTAFVDPSVDPRGVGYNSTQSLIAIGSGQLFGKGLLGGGQTTGRFVPEQHTDFIFTVAGEEFGFLGSVTVVALLGLVLLRGLWIARHCTDRFGTLMAGTIVCWFTFQMFVNVGMTIGIMPITGLPLPFVSYGGTSTFANLIGVGLLQAIHVRQRAFG
ncbi:rod shape-determining protein RodA [Nonomuraea sp. MCN248]|uniref:peptidoglycan glycosyltransferase n=1 Tax=Nonomuraea corallina TaxID=2989783 RepID=A0ABT4SP36_9ACTN|nr:rod shape-determining protein RodA [Nonomuraea corallina]MDA0638651.1 rod shape-determining protein RodA [Nonomuraea corallina]